MFDNDQGIQTTKVKISAREFLSHVAFLIFFSIFTIVCSTTTILEDTMAKINFDTIFGPLDRALDAASDQLDKSFMSSKKKNDHWQKHMDECKFHSAISSIPKTGSGLFAGKDMDENEPIMVSTSLTTSSSS